MKLNEHTVIKGQLVILVPYEEYHVPKYHEWMKSEELQILTASEPLSLEEEYKMQKNWRTDPDINDEVLAMVGDTNFFLTKVNNITMAEVEIMIAENSARGKGLGKEALLLMLRYGIENLNIDTFEAKIKSNNHKSISLFTKIGFQKISESKIFEEVTFEKKVTDTWTDWLLTQTKCYNKKER